MKFECETFWEQFFHESTGNTGRLFNEHQVVTFKNSLQFHDWANEPIVDQESS